LKVILNDEKSFNGKYFNVKFSNILKKATKSKECFSGKCLIQFGDNFQLRAVKDSPV
jgi:hypothetical protein